jgi:preprotein translocase subunit SecD
MSAIVDANVTTLITAIVLYFFGAGPVRGFAVALGIGIVTSVFSALYVTRLIVGIWFNWRKPKVLVV